MATIIALASGKGGVGKTLLTAALALALHRQGKKVLAADADMGLRNLDLMFGMQDEVLWDGGDSIKQRCQFREAVLEVLPGLDFLPASQRHTWEKLDAPAFQYGIEKLARAYDYVVVDCPPGRGYAYKAATAIADRLLLVVAPTRTSVRDVSRMIQYCRKHKQTHYAVLLNNFLGHTDPAYLSAAAVLQALDSPPLAGILPHREEIHAAAQQGTLGQVKENPFFTSLQYTVTYIQTQKSVDPQAVWDSWRTAGTERSSLPTAAGDEATAPGEVSIPEKALRSLQEAAAVAAQWQSPTASVEMDEAAGKPAEAAGKISWQQRRDRSYAWRRYRR